jgi:hypothetical protein
MATSSSTGMNSQLTLALCDLTARPPSQPPDLSLRPAPQPSECRPSPCTEQDLNMSASSTEMGTQLTTIPADLTARPPSQPPDVSLRSIPELSEHRPSPFMEQGLISISASTLSAVSETRNSPPNNLTIRPVAVTGSRAHQL